MWTILLRTKLLRKIDILTLFLLYFGAEWFWKQRMNNKTTDMHTKKHTDRYMHTEQKIGKWKELAHLISEQSREKLNMERERKKIININK